MGRKKKKNKMITSIPKTALELNINLQGYTKLARNVGRMKLLTNKQKEKILDRADKELPKEIFSRAMRLIEDITNDKEVYKIAEIPYSQGPPQKGQRLFTTAVADYFLRNKE